MPSSRPPLWISGLAFALGLLVLLRALLPIAVEKLAEQEGSAAIAGRLAIADVDLELLRGAVVIEGVAISADAASAPPVLRLERARVDLDWLPLIAGRLGLSLVAIDGLSLRLERSREGVLELGGLGPLPMPAAQQEKAAAEPQAEPEGMGSWPVAIRRISLRNVELELGDQQPATPLEVRLRLEDFDLDDLSLEPPATAGDPWGWRFAAAELREGSLTVGNAALQQPLELELAARASDGAGDPEHAFPVRLRVAQGPGWLEADGRVQLAPLSAAVDVDWKSLDLTALVAAVLPDRAEMLKSGFASGALELELRSPQPDRPPAEAAAESSDPGLRIRGSVELRDLEAASSDPPAAAAWKALDLEIGELWLPLPGAAGETGETLAEAEAAGASEKSAPLRLELSRIQLENARLSLTDRSLDPPLETRLSGVQMQGRGLRWPRPAFQQIRVQVASLGEEPLEIEGGAADRGHRLALTGKRISLLPFAPYLEHHSDYSLSGGLLTLEGEVQLAGEAFSSNTHLELDELGLASEEGAQGFEETFGIPLNLALALLRDASGTISLDLPVEGSTSELRVELASILADALRSVIIGALSAPLKLVGSLLPTGQGQGGGLAILPVEFAPGEAVLAEGSGAQLEQLAGFLGDRPELALRLEARVAAVDLAGRVEVESSPNGVVPALDESALAELARLGSARSAAVRDALLELGVDAARLIEAPTPKALVPGPPGVALDVEVR
jgi:hypothetical protein